LVFLSRSNIVEILFGERRGRHKHSFWRVRGKGRKRKWKRISSGLSSLDDAVKTINVLCCQKTSRGLTSSFKNLLFFAFFLSVQNLLHVSSTPPFFLYPNSHKHRFWYSQIPTEF
jgi:hypothetical protein